MPLVPLLGFTPDVEVTTPGAMLDCSNMVPTLRGMTAAPGAIATSYPASAEAVTGAALLAKLDASVRFFVGGATLLQEGTAGAWANVSRGGGYAAGDNRWRFAQFGNDSLAANKSCPLQRSTGAAFSDLVAPKASVCDTASGFVILGDCNDTGTGLATGFGDQPNRWWCCAINDVATWTPSVSTQCASGLLVDAPGPIRAMRRLGANMVAYKDTAIFLGSYVGAQAGVWQWSMLPGDIGCSSQEAVVNIGTAHLFVGQTDIYSFDGTRPVPIGAPLRQWFFARLNRSYQYKIAALHDRVNGAVWWFYPSTTSDLGELDEAIVYNYRAQRWGAVTQSVEMPIEIVLGGITYDSLGALFSTYDALPAISYDSPFWLAGSPVPGIVGTDHRPYTLSGPAGNWNFTSHSTGDEQIVSLLSRLNVRWITRPSAATLTHLFSMDEGDPLTAAPAISMGTLGRFDLLRAARWHRMRLAGTGAAELVGLDAQIRPESAE